MIVFIHRHAKEFCLSDSIALDPKVTSLLISICKSISMAEMPSVHQTHLLLTHALEGSNGLVMGMKELCREIHWTSVRGMASLTVV